MKKILLFFSIFVLFVSNSYTQEPKKYTIPDKIYLLINEKAAIKNITRKNNNYTRTSLLRLLEINGELTSFYIDVGDAEEINISYNESYEIIEYLRNFNRESEFYPSGLVRFAYILYKIKEYNSCLEYLETAKESKYLTEDSYVFAIKIAAQVHYELGNFQNVIGQFALVKDRFYDKLDDDLLLVYAKALLKRQNFALAYSTLTKFIRSMEQKKKGFSKNLLDNIHIFFVEADKVDEGIAFLKRYAPLNLAFMATYILSKNKGVLKANRTFKQYSKYEKDTNRYFENLLAHLQQLKDKGLYRHMTYFMRVGANFLTKKKSLNKKFIKEYSDLMFLTLGDHIKFNITPIYTRRLCLILKDAINGFDAHLDFILAKHYFKNIEYKKSYRYFDQAYRLSSSDYESREKLIPKIPTLIRDRKKIIKVSLDYMYLLFSEKVKRLLPDDESKELLENYNTDYPKGKYTHKVFLSLIKIYLDQAEFQEASIRITRYLNRFPNNVEVYRQPIQDLMNKVLKEPDPRKQDAFLNFIASQDFKDQIFKNKNELTKLAKAEYLFSLNLFQDSLAMIKQLNIKDFKQAEEKNRYLLFSARIHLKNILFKQSSKLLIQYINRATMRELEQYSDILIEAMEEFYNLQDLATPYIISKTAFERTNSKMKSFAKYLSSFLFAMIINKKNQEYVSFIQENKQLFNVDVVNQSLKRSIDFLLLDKNFDMLLAFIENFASKIQADFALIERINLKFHEFIIKNKKKEAIQFQNFLVENIEKFNIKENFKNRIYNYFKVRDLLYQSFKDDLIEWNLSIQDHQDFLNENIRQILKVEERIDEFRGEYAYTDFLITAYFLYQYDRLKRLYKKRFDREYKKVAVTQLVDLDRLDQFDPMQILSIKETAHRNFIIGMTTKVRLFTSDIQLVLNQALTRNFQHYFDYSPFPFIDRLNL